MWLNNDNCDSEMVSGGFKAVMKKVSLDQLVSSFVSLKSIFLLICLSMGNQAANAFTMKMTKTEFETLSFECKAIYSITRTGRNDGFGDFLPANQRETWRLIGEKYGGAWHYCGGLIYFRRAEISIKKWEKEKNYDKAAREMAFSFGRMKKKPGDKTSWAPMMATDIARARRKLGETEEAIKMLNSALRYNPKYLEAHVEYGLLHYHNGRFENAKASFMKANELAGGASSQIIYFLGLASLELGEIEEAKKYELEAAKKGYPLKGLKNKIEVYEQAELAKQTKN